MPQLNCIDERCVLAPHNTTTKHTTMTCWLCPKAMRRYIAIALRERGRTDKGAGELIVITHVLLELKNTYIKPYTAHTQLSNTNHLLYALGVLVHR